MRCSRSVGNSSRDGMQLESERACHLHDRRKARVAVRAQRPVQAFAAQASVRRDLRHAFRPSDIPQRPRNAGDVVGRLVEPGVQIGGHFLGRAQLFRHVVGDGPGLPWFGFGHAGHP